MDLSGLWTGVITISGLELSVEWRGQWAGVVSGLE